MLENATVLREYIAQEIGSRCAACDSPRASEAEITREIDGAVNKGIFSRKNITRVDYLMPQPFALGAIAAMRSRNRHDAVLVLDFAPNSCTAMQIEDKYGSPQDKTIFQWFSVFEYRVSTKSYAARAAFTIDPVSGAAQRIAISLKRKNPSE